MSCPIHKWNGLFQEYITQYWRERISWVITGKNSYVQFLQEKCSLSFLLSKSAPGKIWTCAKPEFRLCRIKLCSCLTTTPRRHNPNSNNLRMHQIPTLVNKMFNTHSSLIKWQVAIISKILINAMFNSYLFTKMKLSEER